MKTSKALKEARTQLQRELQGLMAKGENCSVEEQQRADELAAEVEAHNGLIDAAEKREKAAAAAAGASAPGSEEFSEGDKKDLRKFSLIRAMRNEVNHKSQDGIEKEVRDMAEKEAKDQGLSLTGFGLPGAMMRVAQNNREQRASDVATAAAAGDLVATDLGELIPVLMPRLQVVALGGRVMGGLVGNLDLPRDTTNLSASWETETGDADSTDPTLAKISLTPHRLAAFTAFSKQLINQGSLDVEAWLRRKLSDAIAIAVDAAAINGSGSSNQPTGILNNAGITTVAMGTNGAVPTWAKVVELETSINAANADIGELAYLMTPGLWGKLKTTEKVASTNAQFILGEDAMVNGYTSRRSTQVPSTLTKGTSSGVCHAMIFAHWAKLIIANWGLVDITVDPYTLAKSGQMQLVVNSFWDIALEQPKCFAASKDMLIS